MCGLSVVAAAAAQSQADPQRPIRVGVGVNAGEAVAAAEGYVGSAVNIAARVCAQAKAGEVLVTDTVRGLTRTSGRLTFTPVGRRALKGIAEPVALFRAEVAGSGLLVAPGGSGPFWRRRSTLAAAGGLLVVLLAVVAVKGGFLPAGASPSASTAASLPPAVPVERIAYTQVRSYAGEVEPSCGSMLEGRAFLMDPASGKPVRITHGGDLSETHLAWSPDGSQLAFIGATHSSANNVYLTDVATGVATRLMPETPPEGLDLASSIDSVSWSADGTSLVFSNGSGIWTVGTDGAGLHRLPVTMPSGPTPAPSAASATDSRLVLAPISLPDGRIAALLQDIAADYPREALTRLAIQSAPGGGELTPVAWIPSTLTLAGMGWSQDRSRVALIGADLTQLDSEGTPTWDLYVAGADGSDMRKLTPAHGTDSEALNRTSDPAWSPDGRQIVFGSGTLYIVDADGGQVRELPGIDDRAACWPSWSRTTTAVLPRPVPTLAPGATPAPRPYHEGLLDPGIYVTDLFRPQLQLKVGSGWEGYLNTLDQLQIKFSALPRAELDVEKVQVGVVGSCFDSPTRVIADPPDLVAFLQGHPNLKVGNVAPFNAEGLGVSGLSVDISVSTVPTQADCPTQPEFTLKQIPLFIFGERFDVIPADFHARVIALSVDGAILSFIVYAPPDQYDRFNSEVQQILDTLTYP
jgi:Tol biopolymer transport system component